MKQRFILFVSTLVLSIAFGSSAFAEPVEVDGIYYNLDTTNKTAEVTYKDIDYKSYSGDVIIPESITLENVKYSVLSIGENAFRDSHQLTSIEIPNSVNSIGKYAFFYCM